MTTRTAALWTVVASTGLLPAVVPARAQDPVKVGPTIYKTVFENDAVRLCSITFKPGEKIAMHSHPDHLVYILTEGKLKLSYADGKTQDLEGKPGAANWIKAESHAAENVGNAEFRGIVVEFKKAAQPGAKPAAPPEGQDPVKTDPAKTKVVFENERVRVLESHLKPGEKLAMHWHPANLIYALTDAKAKFTDSAGKVTEKALAAGAAMWSDAVSHTVENVGPAEMGALNIEFKDPVEAAPKAKAG
ncbi:MAG: hypothetical protein IT449_09720 [Phycisphaerales bacterium]|nr:hypothetical protein [Phycisphaerales bacterium]